MSSEEFQKKWQEYVQDFLQTPTKELEALKKGNLLEKENRNILEHLLKARLETEVLCDLLGVSGMEKEAVVKAATIHDAFVLDEKTYIRNKTRNGEPADYKDLQYVKAQSAKKLSEMGFPENVIALTNENITHEYGGPKDLPSKIIFFVDANLDGSNITDIPQRFEKTRHGWRSDRKEFDEETAKGTEKYWKEFFKGAPGHGDQPHDVVQLDTARKICKEFVQILLKTHAGAKNSKYGYIFGDGGDPNMLPYYIEDKLREKIV